jgi:hypothetical protein
MFWWPANPRCHSVTHTPPLRRSSRPSHYALAAIVLFAIFRGSQPFLASAGLPLGQRVFGTQLARMSLNNVPRKASDQGGLPRVIVEVFEVCSPVWPL